VLFVLLPQPSRPVILIDASALGDPGAHALEALARLQLTACRSGVQIELYNASAALVDLLDLVGLADVLPARAGSGLEPDRQVELGEQALVDEVVDTGDATA
jgi:hypothetical protein